MEYTYKVIAIWALITAFASVPLLHIWWGVPLNLVTALLCLIAADREARRQ